MFKNMVRQPKVNIGQPKVNNYYNELKLIFIYIKMAFECKCCKYKTIYKTNFEKHLLTNKHKKNNEIIDDKPFTCKYCSQKYKYKQSLSKHVKYSCTKNKDEDLKELVRLLNNQNKQLEIRLDNQNKQIEKLMGKLEINNSFNTTNIQNITLLSYKETDTSHLTDIDYTKCIKKINGCVVEMIKRVHFNPEKPENMNIYISNMKDKYIMVYENGNWDLKIRDKQLDEIYADKEIMLEDWLELHKDPELNEKFNKYLKLKEDDKNFKGLQEEIKLLMYNNKTTVHKQLQG